MSDITQITVLPVWHANTAYSLYARATKVTADGTVWWITTAGTSGGVEPTWPTTYPWTVTDGTAVWSIADGFRQNNTSGIYSALTAFRDANAPLIRGCQPARPKSMQNFEKPGVYIGARDETIEYAGQMRQRTITGVIGVVDTVPDNYEAMARMDAIIDGLMDLISAVYHASGGNTIFGQTSVTEVAYDEGGVPYNEVLISYTAHNQTGRT